MFKWIGCGECHFTQLWTAMHLTLDVHITSRCPILLQNLTFPTNVPYWIHYEFWQVPPCRHFGQFLEPLPQLPWLKPRKSSCFTPSLFQTKFSNFTDFIYSKVHHEIHVDCLSWGGNIFHFRAHQIKRIRSLLECSHCKGGLALTGYNRGVLFVLFV